MDAAASQQSATLPGGSAEAYRERGRRTLDDIVVGRSEVKPERNGSGGLQYLVGSELALVQVCFILRIGTRGRVAPGILGRWVLVRYKVSWRDCEGQYRSRGRGSGYGLTCRVAPMQTARGNRSLCLLNSGVLFGDEI